MNLECICILIDRKEVRKCLEEGAIQNVFNQNCAAFTKLILLQKVIQSFIMSGFFGKLKQVFVPKQPPKFKIYEAAQLKMIAMKTRLVLETRMNEHLKHITHADQQFKYAGQDPSKIYNILQVIGDKVVEVQSMKLLIQMMRKVQNLGAQIVKTNGDITLMRKQLLWFQCVLWFRKSKGIDNLQQLYKFCLDFFKGVDITTQLNVKCEVFQIYPVLKFLKNGEVLPLREILFYIQPYVSCNIQQTTLDNVFRINAQQIKKKVEQNLPNKQMFSTIPQNQGSLSHVYSQSNIYTPYSPPQNQQNSRSFINPYLNTSDHFQPVDQSNIPFNNPNNHDSFNLNSQVYKNSTAGNQFDNNNPIHHKQNTSIVNDAVNKNENSNANYQKIQNNNINNNFGLQKIDQLPAIPQYNQTSNSLNINSNSNVFSNVKPNQQVNNQYSKPNHNFIPSENIIKTQYNKQPLKQKPSFYNTLLRVNSVQQNKPNFNINIGSPETQKALDINYNKERQNQAHLSQQFQSMIPFNRDIKEELKEDEFQRQIRELEQFQMGKNLIIQEQIKRKQNQRKQNILREQKQREERQKQRVQAERVRQQQLRIKRLEQQHRLKVQNQRKMQEDRKLQEQMQKRREQEERFKLLREQQQRRQKQQEQRERQYQIRRLQRQRELRQSQVQLNIFADNQRQQVERGNSGSFNSPFGMKIDFGQNEGEQFNFQSPEQVSTSVLRFSKIKEPEIQQQNHAQLQASSISQQQKESLNIIRELSAKGSSPSFKLFYFKMMESSA